MHRIITVVSTAALALATMACNPATAKDSDTVWFDTIEAAEGVSGRGLRLSAGVDAQARDMETIMEVNLSVIGTDDVYPSVEMTVLAGDLPSAGTGGDNGSADIEIPSNFSSCDGPGYTAREDGGCNWTSDVLVLSDGPQSAFLNFKLRAFADDGWEGDKDSVNIVVDAVALDPEPQG